MLSLRQTFGGHENGAEGFVLRILCLECLDTTLEFAVLFRILRVLVAGVFHFADIRDAVVKRLAEEGIPFEKVVAVGGISKKSPFVMRTMADVMGVPIDVLDSDQACALGAAMFASVAAGIHGSVAEAQAAMSPEISETYYPDPERHAIFGTLYSRYKKLGLFCQRC